MSTEFRTADTDEWGFTRWAAGHKMGVDFGSAARFNRVVEMALTNVDVTFVGDDGTEVTAGDVLTLALEGRFPVSPGKVVAARPTFGEFVGTVELGSGDLLDRMGVEGV
jgi:hypothetical protein